MKREGGRGREKEGEKREEGEGEGRKRRDEEEEKRERGEEGREKRGFFFLTFQRHFLSGQELLSSLSPPFFSLSLPYTSQTPVLNSPLPSEWVDRVGHELKKKSKAIDTFPPARRGHGTKGSRGHLGAR